MKKNVLVIAAIALFLASCGSTYQACPAYGNVDKRGNKLYGCR